MHRDSVTGTWPDQRSREIDRLRDRRHDSSMFLFAFDLIELNGDDLSIGIESGPLIGVQKGPSLDIEGEASRERARLH